jgi:death-on-curing family protein
MSDKYVYPTKDSIRTINEIVNLTSTKKADSFKLLRPEEFIDSIIEDVRKTEGSIYEKAAVLLRRIIVAHGFASGNKRTAFIVTAYFIEENGGRLTLNDFDIVERVLRNIRLYNEKEISNWLKTGDIDETRFKE